MRTILAFFGYVKVPKEAIQMSMLIEDDFKDMIIVCSIEGERNPKFKQFAENLKVRQEVVATLTKFLRSGKLLNG